MLPPEYSPAYLTDLHMKVTASLAWEGSRLHRDAIQTLSAAKNTWGHLALGCKIRRSSLKRFSMSFVMFGHATRYI